MNKITISLLLLIPITFVLGLGTGYLVWGRTTTPQIAAQVEQAVQATTTAAAAPKPPENVQRYPVSVDDDYIYGPAEAPITLIEFSDFQCPYCQKWYTEVFAALLKNYPGQIRFVYRDFPLLSIHPQSLPAAQAANCAGEQGKYYEYHNLLFGGGLTLGPNTYDQYATKLALDMTKFDDCVSTERTREEIMADLQWATELGVQSTPTFFINGIPLVGAQPYENFSQIIDWELAGVLPHD